MYRTLYSATCVQSSKLAGVEGLFGPSGLTPPGPPFGRYPSSANSSSRTNFQSTNRSNRKNLAGVEGFEPPYGGIKTRCLTAWRHPNLESTISKATRGRNSSRPPIFQPKASRSVREPNKHSIPAARDPRFRGLDPWSRGPKKRRPRCPSAVRDQSPTANRARVPPEDTGAAPPPSSRFARRTPENREL